MKDKVEGFLNPDGEKEREREKRRARSHVDTRSRRSREYDDGYSDEERYARRSTKGSRRDRDDYY